METEINTTEPSSTSERQTQSEPHGAHSAVVFDVVRENYPVDTPSPRVWPFPTKDLFGVRG